MGTSKSAQVWVANPQGLGLQEEAKILEKNAKLLGLMH